MGVEFILIAGLLVAVSNFCMRKSVDAGGNTKAFLMIQLFIVFLIAILLNPIRTDEYSWSTKMASFGFVGGLLLAVMMASLGRALERGPAGLTFAILNCSTVMPALLMAVFFGEKFDCLYHFSHGLGSFLVVLGLIWAGAQALKSGIQKNWAYLAALAFICHTLFLVMMQWRVLFIRYPGEDGLFLSFDTTSAKSQWFMPMAFLAATLGQVYIYLKTEKRIPNKKELFWGIFGGLFNGIGTFFMIRATEVATPLEQAMLFPLFSISIIMITNGWGRALYKEKVNWYASILCVLGILIGTVNWSAIF